MDTDELPLLDESSYVINSSEEDTFSRKQRKLKKYRKSLESNKGRKLLYCIVVSSVCIFIPIALFTMHIAISSVKPVVQINPHSTQEVNINSFYDWIAEFSHIGSEAPVRVVNVNNDGVLDILIGVTVDSFLKEKASGAIIAVDGRNGSVLWKILTKDDVFELFCPNIDINSDGLFDCFGSGRFGTVVVFQPQTGETIWSMPKSANPKWSMFGPAFIHDLDGDKIQDIVFVNGGDARYSPEEHNRLANDLFVLSGASGELIGRKLPIPDGKESYSLPVVYTHSDGSQYIIFGSGGETVSGGLYMIALPDLFSYIDANSKSELPGSYNAWPGLTKGEHGIITLYTTASKGVMLPVTLVDINNDKRNDIISLTHDGVLLAFSGADLTYLWNPLNFTMERSTESYTMPGFGYFNDDDQLDIMVTWQTGEYPKYDTQLVLIIDGKSGGILWYKQTPSNTYTAVPILTMSTSIERRDAFIFPLSSLNEKFVMDVTDDQKVFGKRSLKDGSRVRRHIGMHDAVEKNSCNSLSGYTMDFLIMDRSNMTSPLRLFQQTATPYYYNITSETVEKANDMKKLDSIISGKSQHPQMSSDHDHRSEQEMLPEMPVLKCARMTPRDSSAGVIVDLDGDNSLDFVILITSYAKQYLDLNEVYTEPALRSSLLKFSLEKILSKLEQVNLNDALVNMESGDNEPKLSNVKLASSDKQRWPQLKTMQ